VALLAEVIVHRPVDRGEFLQGLHAAKALHDPFSAPERQVGVLDPIVQPAADLLAAGRSDLGQRRLVGSEAVGDDGARASCRFSAFLMKLSAAALSRSLVTKDSSTSPSWSTARQR